MLYAPEREEENAGTARGVCASCMHVHATDIAAPCRWANQHSPAQAKATADTLIFSSERATSREEGRGRRKHCTQQSEAQRVGFRSSTFIFCDREPGKDEPRTSGAAIHLLSLSSFFSFQLARRRNSPQKKKVGGLRERGTIMCDPVWASLCVRVAEGERQEE